MKSKLKKKHPDVETYCREKCYLNSSCYRTKDGYLYFLGEEYQQKYATEEDDDEPKDRMFIHEDNNQYTNLRWTSRSLNQRNQKIS